MALLRPAEAASRVFLGCAVPGYGLIGGGRFLGAAGFLQLLLPGSGGSGGRPRRAARARLKPGKHFVKPPPDGAVAQINALRKYARLFQPGSGAFGEAGNRALLRFSNDPMWHGMPRVDTGLRIIGMARGRSTAKSLAGLAAL